jgi:hypothetical protein
MGPIIAIVRKIAKPVITMFGGAEPVPRDVLAMPRTIIILVNDVIVNTIAGANVSVVKRSTNFILAERGAEEVPTASPLTDIDMSGIGSFTLS